MSTPLRLSIIVCTRNRSYAITDCLNAIQAALTQAMPLQAEIVIVDNASTDNTAEVIRNWAAGSAIPLQLVYEAKTGLAVARNTAIRAARGALLAFTDDDCIMAADYLTRLLQLDAADTEPVIRGGRVDLGTPDDLPLTIITKGERKRWSRQQDSARHENLGDTFYGCNMTMRRSVIDHVGFFDELFGAGAYIPAGEDMDYLFRAYLAGVVLDYCPDLVVTHFHGRKTAAQGYKLFRQYMIANGALYAKYLFRDWRISRPFWWDIKNAARELATGRNSFLPLIGFSHKHKVAYALRGVIAYLSKPRSGPQAES